MAEVMQFMDSYQGGLLFVLVIVNVIQVIELRDWKRRVTSLENFVYPPHLKGTKS